jgi:hypothetical protein
MVCQKDKKQDLVFLFLKEKTDDRPIPYLNKSKEQLIDLEWSLQLCFPKHEKILQNVICLCEIQCGLLLLEQ